MFKKKLIHNLFSLSLSYLLSLSHRYCNDYLNTKVSDGGIKLPLFEPEANDVIGDGRIHSYTGLRGDAFIFHPWAMHRFVLP